jgi:hypothetical protein
MVPQTKTAEPTVVNGINVDDLFALIDGVKRNAATGKTDWRVTTTWQGGTQSRAQIDGFPSRFGRPIKPFGGAVIYPPRYRS